MNEFLEKLKNKQDLSFNESKAAFELLMEGKASDDQIFNFLTLLSSNDKSCLFFSFSKNFFISF